MCCAKPSASFSMPRKSSLLIFVAVAFALTARADFLDKVHDTLSLSDSQNRFHLQLSGLADLEAYSIDQPAPGLIFSEHDFLLNPRLTLFLDLEIGANVYFFAQARMDRGFDPSDGGARGRTNTFFATLRRRTSISRSDNLRLSSAT